LITFFPALLPSSILIEPCHVVIPYLMPQMESNHQQRMMIQRMVVWQLVLDQTRKRRIQGHQKWHLLVTGLRFVISRSEKLHWLVPFKMIK
jgi:hypothetical protein